MIRTILKWVLGIGLIVVFAGGPAAGAGWFSGVGSILGQTVGAAGFAGLPALRDGFREGANVSPEIIAPGPLPAPDAPPAPPAPPPAGVAPEPPMATGSVQDEVL